MPDSNDISSMVEKIVKNPEFTELVNGLRGGSTDGAMTDKSVADKPAVTSDEIMSRLPEVMSMLTPLMGGGNTDKSAQSDIPETHSSPSDNGGNAVKSEASRPALFRKGDKSRAEKLMAALKPYLNQSRCEIIDRCVSVMQITDVVEALQGIEELGKKPKS